MNNYEYIIASLPVLQPDSREDVNADELIGEIRSHLSSKDSASVDFLLDGWNADALGEDFYRKALDSSVRFIREYFGYDLTLRNTKVRYLNGRLHRPTDQDTVNLGLEDDAEEVARIDEVLSQEDILAKERGLDNLLWQKIDDITVLDNFDIDEILGFIAKLKIVDRWLKLDEATGRELFAKLVREIKENYTI